MHFIVLRERNEITRFGLEYNEKPDIKEVEKDTTEMLNMIATRFPRPTQSDGKFGALEVTIDVN